MVIDILLIIALAIFIALHFRNKAEIKRLRNTISQPHNRSTDKHEEFSLGMTRLNSEFTGNIVLDPLTGLPGRDAFDDRFKQAIVQSRRFEKSFAIAMLDIHEFGVINKAQGHDIGDKLLREVAKRLKGVIRQIDTMSRYAGDTFVFLLPQLAMPETAAYVAQRLLDSIVQPFEIDNQKIFITASVGVSIFPLDGEDIKTLLKNTADALLQAKLSGSSRYQFFRQELHALGQRELSIHKYLCDPDLLKNLKIYYRQYVNVKTMEMAGIQAVPYMELPDIGSLPFSAFSRVAENCGKILEIGEWLLRNAIMQYQKWHSEGFAPHYLVINVTLRQIENPNFIYKVSEIVQQLNMSPGKLVFEVSGENLFSNTSALEKAFSMLSHTGIKISVSIFALGHLALQKITKLPINYLKIDSKLINDKEVHKDNDVIIHMLVTLAKDMHIDIICEGIETEKQKDTLIEAGCEIMQGKLFGEPLIVDTTIHAIN